MRRVLVPVLVAVLLAPAGASAGWGGLSAFAVTSPSEAGVALGSSGRGTVLVADTGPIPPQLVESRKLLAHCRDHGIVADMPYARRELFLGT